MFYLLTYIFTISCKTQLEGDYMINRNSQMNFQRQNQMFNPIKTVETKLPERKKQTRISISFKDDEMWIYEKLCEHSSPSAWIKDILKIYYKQ